MMGAMRAPAACAARRCAPARPCGRVRRAAARACSGGSDGLTEGQRRFAERKAAMADRVRAAYEAEAAKDAGTHGDAVDVSKLSEAQRAFLKRKKFVAEGGDPMAGVPVCKVCNGTGAVECPKCEGTGRNKEDVFEGGGLSVAVSGFSAEKGGICWLCRGVKTMPCQACTGTGRSKASAAINYAPED